MKRIATEDLISAQHNPEILFQEMVVQTPELDLHGGSGTVFTSHLKPSYVPKCHSVVLEIMQYLKQALLPISERKRLQQHLTLFSGFPHHEATVSPV